MCNCCKKKRKATWWDVFLSISGIVTVLWACVLLLRSTLVMHGMESEITFIKGMILAIFAIYMWDRNEFSD